MKQEKRPAAILREIWIKDNLARFQKAKTQRQFLTALNRAYDETVYHQIILAEEMRESHDDMATD